MNKKQRFSVYKMIQDELVAKLEAGVNPWKKPWKGGSAGWPKNVISNKRYRGINVMLLAMQGHDSPNWLTANQAAKLCETYAAQAERKLDKSCKLSEIFVRSAKKGKKDFYKAVAKGEKSTVVVFYNFKDVEQKDGSTKSQYMGMRYYRVFNVAQLAPQLQDELKKRGKFGVDTSKNDDKLDFSPIEECEAIIDGYEDKPEIKHDKPQAYYSPSIDYINMPKKETFESEEGYYATLFHEAIHSTGHTSRLDRLDLTTFGSEKYSKEELVAEFGSAMLCGIAGIENATLDNSASYLSSWASKLKEEDSEKWVIQACQAAQKACDHILPKVEEPSEEVVATATA